VDLIFRVVKYSSVTVFEETVNELIGDNVHPPMIQKIKEALYAARRKLGESSDPWEQVRAQIFELERSSQVCSRCFNSGVVVAHRRTANDLYCFTCTCQAGDLAAKLPENKGKIRSWSMALEHDWVIEGKEDQPPPHRERPNLNQLAQSKDLNKAIAKPPVPYRDDDDDDNWPANF
jgi:hypothetical protein